MAYHQKARRLSSSPLIKSSDRSPNISAKRSLSNQLLDRSPSTTLTAKRSLFSNEIDRSQSTTPPAKRLSSSNQTLVHSLNITYPPSKRSKTVLGSALSHSQPSLAAKTLLLNRATRSLQLSSNRRTTDGSPNSAHSSSKRSRTILQPGFNKSHLLSSNRGTPDCYNANGNKRKSSSQEILVRESAPLICEDALPPLQTSLTSKSPTRFTQKTPPYRSSTPLSFNSEEITTNHQNEENIIEVNHNVHKSSLLSHHSKTPHDLAYSNEIYKQEESLLIMIAQSLKKQEKLHKQTNELLKVLLVKNNNTSINDDECNYEEVEKFVISELKLPLKTKNEFVKANKILENEDIAQKFVSIDYYNHYHVIRLIIQIVPNRARILYFKKHQFREYSVYIVLSDSKWISQFELDADPDFRVK